LPSQTHFKPFNYRQGVLVEFVRVIQNVETQISRVVYRPTVVVYRFFIVTAREEAVLDEWVCLLELESGTVNEHFVFTFIDSGHGLRLKAFEHAPANFTAPCRVVRAAEADCLRAEAFNEKQNLVNDVHAVCVEVVGGRAHHFTGFSY